MLLFENIVSFFMCTFQEKAVIPKLPKVVFLDV